MRVAAVDLGTNSTRLLVADVSDGRVTEVVRRLAITRLGEGVDESDTLLARAIERVHAVLDRQYQAEVRRFDALPSASATSMIRVTPKVRPRSGGELPEDIARGWMQASLLMQQLLSSRGARYVHVLQPNQYFTTRPFAPGEAEVALADGSPFKPGAEQGYPAIERAVASGGFSGAGVTFVNGVHLFDAERTPVYIDNCCHYTRRGYEILADAIAKAVGG